MKGKLLDILMVMAIIAIGFLFFELVSGNQELKKSANPAAAGQFTYR